MMRYIAIIAALAVMLGGCMLQSRTPLYSDADAELALGAEGGAAAVSNWRDGRWEAESDDVSLGVSGRHYMAKAQSGAVALHFVPMGGSWYVLQASEPGKPAVYLLAEVTGRSAVTHPLPCSDLKKDPSLTAWISHEGDDCFVVAGIPPHQLFAALLKHPAPASSRLELAP